MMVYLRVFNKRGATGWSSWEGFYVGGVTLIFENISLSSGGIDANNAITFIFPTIFMH